jgi:HEPN domain-containing protein
LAGLLEQAGVHLPNEVLDAGALTSFAVQARYPNFDEAVTKLEYENVITTAGQVIKWAERIINKQIG